MELRQWREQLESALLRQRLPRVEIERLVEELSDHAADLLMDAKSMDALHSDLEARLGTPDDVAHTAKQQFLQRTFAGRHPAWTFLVGPLVTWMSCLLAIILLYAAILYSFDALSGGALAALDEEHAPAAWELALVYMLNNVVRFAPFAISSWCFFALGRRTGHHTWSIASCGILTLFALLFSSIVTNYPDGHGTWQIGLSCSLQAIQLLQAIVPACFGIGMLRQLTSRNRLAAT